MSGEYLFHVARRALEAARIHGHDCRDLRIEQPVGMPIVAVAEGNSRVYWVAGCRLPQYAGRPSKALEFIGAALRESLTK